MRKKYLKGIVAGMMVGAVVIVDGRFTCATTVQYESWEDQRARNFDRKYYATDAADYAIKWSGKEGTNDTSGYNNKKFQHFVGKGGDCTNFVSQCVAKGGMVIIGDHRDYDNDIYKVNRLFSPTSKDEWYNEKNSDGDWKVTDTWINCDTFEEYMREKRSIPSYRKKDLEFIRKNAKIGDVVQVVVGNDIKHSMIVTDVTSKDVLLAGHSRNRKYATLQFVYDDYDDNNKKKITLNLLKFTKFK